MKSMIERVARAMWAADGVYELRSFSHDDFAWHVKPEHEKIKLRLMARAAIEAMRDPTAEMGIDGLMAWVDACGNPPELKYDDVASERRRLLHIGSMTVSSSQLYPAWRAMIDAALNEEGEQ